MVDNPLLYGETAPGWPVYQLKKSGKSALNVVEVNVIGSNTVFPEFHSPTVISVVK